MSAAKLTIVITLFFLAQAAIWGGVAFYRHWRDYVGLKQRASSGDCAAPSVSVAKRASAAAPSWEGFREFRVQRKVFEDEHKTMCSFYLVPVDGARLLPFRPGQYLTFRFVVNDPSGAARTVVRCYSLSDRPHPDHYRVTIKRVPAPNADVPPGVGSNHFHDRIHEGDIVSVKAPSGNFYLEDAAHPIALVGGGIGITPMLSMVNHTLEQARGRDVWLFYGVRSRDDHIMKAHLETLARNHPNLHLHVCHSRPHESDVEGVDYQHRGHVDIRLLRQVLPRGVEDFYICGPTQMMEALVPALEAWGVPAHKIHYEAFGPASIAKAPKKQDASAAQDALAAVTVTFSKSGKSLQWDGKAESLLEFAETHGIAIDSGCRAGSCGCCQTAIESGEVDYRQEPDADLAAGACLLCVSTPKTNLTLSA